MNTPDIARNVVFKDYESAGLERADVVVSDGVIAYTIPDELTAWQARCVAHMLLKAAVELEGQE